MCLLGFSGFCIRIGNLWLRLSNYWETPSNLLFWGISKGELILICQNKMRNKIEKILRVTPDLKGKEIAKKIGVPKKEVNSFLSKHLDMFVQDNNFCWSLAKADEFKVEFEGNNWVDSNSFENSLLSVGSPLDSDCSSVVFIIPERCSILLDAAARLLALCNQLVLSKKVTIDFSGCKSTLSFFDRIGFLDHLNKDVTVLPQRPKESRASKYKGNSEAIVEFGAVDPNKDNKELIVQLGDRFIQQSDSRYETAASTVFGELIGNVKEHSKSPIPGFAALQKYKGRRKHIQTVVSDSGLGIASTLRPSLKEHYPGLYKLHSEASIESDVGLVIATLSQGGISRFGAGRGLGFKSSREQAMKFDAQLSVRQERFCLDFVYKDGELVDVKKQFGLSKILGTHLCFDFFVD